MLAMEMAPTRRCWYLILAGRCNRPARKTRRSALPVSRTRFTYYDLIESASPIGVPYRSGL